VTITGRTRLLAVLGDPIEQVQAPTLVNRLLVRLAVDAVLVPVHVSSLDLAQVMSGLQRVRNLDGMLVTVPHKIAAREFATARSPTVAIAGSTNAIRRDPGGGWFADNFDGAGFVIGLKCAGHQVDGWRVLLAGAGGAGSAIAVALLDAGAAHLSIQDPDTGKLTALLDRLDAAWPGRAAAADAPPREAVDLAVNATPLGLRAADPLPFVPDRLPRSCVIADIVMKPRDTPLLRAAEALGYAVQPGIAMLEHQLDLYQSFFRLGQNDS